MDLGQWARQPWAIGDRHSERNLKQRLQCSLEAKLLAASIVDCKLEKEPVKNLSIPTNIAGTIAALALITACETAGTGQSGTAQQEALLTQSGFKTINVTTPQQQQAVSRLAVGQVSPVRYRGKLYYVYPTGTRDRILVGRQRQVNAYNRAVAAQQTQPGQNNMNPAPTMTFQGHGQHGVVAQQFDGFGPMGTAAMGDW